MLLNRSQRFSNMVSNLSKVHFNKSTSSVDFATEEHIFEFLEMLRGKSHLPIKEMLTMLYSEKVDTVSCSKEETNYTFFASKNRDGISIVVKKLGEERIEFVLPKSKLEKTQLF